MLRFGLLLSLCLPAFAGVREGTVWVRYVKEPCSVLLRSHVEEPDTFSAHQRLRTLNITFGLSESLRAKPGPLVARLKFRDDVVPGMGEDLGFYRLILGQDEIGKPRVRWQVLEDPYWDSNAKTSSGFDIDFDTEFEDPTQSWSDIEAGRNVRLELDPIGGQGTDETPDHLCQTLENLVHLLFWKDCAPLYVSWDWASREAVEASLRLEIEGSNARLHLPASTIHFRADVRVEDVPEQKTNPADIP